MSVTVCIADDHPIVLSGLVSFIAALGSFTILGTATDGEAAAAQILALRPALAVLDFNMPRLSGIEVTRRVGGSCRCILLAASLTSAETYDAVAAGVCGLILKDAAPADLQSCLLTVAAGGTWLPDESLALAAERTRREHWTAVYQTLTGREREIVTLLLDRLSNKEIAHRLEISEGTTKIHLNNIYRKFNGSTRLDILQMAPAASR